MKQLFIIEAVFSILDASPQLSSFGYISGPNLLFEHNNVHKNLFFGAFCCWDDGVSLRDIDLDFTFCHSKVFRLPAKLHDAVAAMQAQSKKSPGYWYMIRLRTSPCFLHHVTGLPFCFHIRLFLLSIFVFVEIPRTLACIVIDIELVDIIF